MDTGSASEFGHHLSVRDALLPRSRLCLCNTKLLKELNLSFQSLIMIDAHHNQIAFPVGREVHGLVLIVTDGGNLSGSVAQARNRFNDWHRVLRIQVEHKLVLNSDIIKFHYAAHFT